MRFQERPFSKEVQEIASAAVEATASHPEDVAKITQGRRYTKQQSFSVDAKSLLWKKMPSRTFIAGEEKSVSAFKVSEYRLTLLLGANAAGDLKLKAVLIYYS